MLYKKEYVESAITHHNGDIPKGRLRPETSSDGPFEPDPDSTGVGIGRYFFDRSILPLPGLLTFVNEA